MNRDRLAAILMSFKLEVLNGTAELLNRKKLLQTKK